MVMKRGCRMTVQQNICGDLKRITIGFSELFRCSDGWRKESGYSVEGGQ